MTAAETQAVMMHAFATDAAGDTTYCEATDPALTGWCVYTRYEGGGDPEPFDISDEQDFTDRDAALAHAQERAERLGCDLIEY